MKKSDEQYRDRASERRQGKAHDFAQVEALAEDFEARNKDLDRDTVRVHSAIDTFHFQS